MRKAGNRRGYVIAFDFGLKHIGVAAGQTITGQARGIATLAAQAGKPDWGLVQKLIDDYAPVQLIVGLPLNMDGSESDLSTRARKFARRLEGHVHLPVDVWDERLTTREADYHIDRARSAGVARTSHELAALLIAESWLGQSAQAAE